MNPFMANTAMAVPNTICPMFFKFQTLAQFISSFLLFFPILKTNYIISEILEVSSTEKQASRNTRKWAG
jgi:hypothetical protein